MRCTLNFLVARLEGAVAAFDAAAPGRAATNAAGN